MNKRYDELMDAINQGHMTPFGVKKCLQEQATAMALTMLNLAKDGKDISELVAEYEETMELISRINDCELYI
jgi:hypothetical protein